MKSVVKKREPNKFGNLDLLSSGGGFSAQYSFAGNSKASQDESKLFVGGLAMMTSEASLSNFFSQFGQVVDCVVMRNEEQRSKGFGFVTLASKEQLTAALNALPHMIDGKMVDSKPAIPRSAGRSTRPPALSGVRDVDSCRLYLVGVTPEHTESQIADYFSTFGSVTKVDIVKDRETGGPRGFAFVHFADHGAVEKCLAQPSHNIGNVQCSVRKAVNKESMIGFQQQMGGFVARSPRMRGAFRSQPYASGRNMGYGQGYGSPAASYPAMQQYPHVNPAVQQYQSGYTGYAAAPTIPGGYAAGAYNPAQMWPPNSQAYPMPNSAPVLPVSSWGAGASSVSDMPTVQGGFSRVSTGKTSSSVGANHPKNFNSNQYY